MIILAILASLAAIGLLCWLLFTLAVRAAGVRRRDRGCLGVRHRRRHPRRGHGRRHRRRPDAGGRSSADHLRPADVAEADRSHRLRRAGGDCWIPRHTWDCEAPHAVRGMADHLLRHQWDRGWYHRFRAGRWNGGGPRPVRPGPRASLIIIVAVAAARPAMGDDRPHRLRLLGLKRGLRIDAEPGKRPSLERLSWQVMTRRYTEDPARRSLSWR